MSSVPGELQYLDPRSTVLRRFTAPGASINTGSYESHTVPIRNGRSAQETFSTDVQGFEILPHSSAVADFTDKAEVDAVYLPEVIAFIKERTGADEVVTRGAVLRRSVSPAEHASQPQAALVHIDYGPEGADMTAARVYAEQFPDGPGYRRALATSFWRAFSPPPQDWPLALCDFRSLRDDEGLPNQLYFVDRIPDDPLAEVDESKMITSGSEFVYSPDHVWWYFPDMTREEILFFVFHDSDHSRAWRVLHSAFRDPTVEDPCRGTASRSAASRSSADAPPCAASVARSRSGRRRGRRAAGGAAPGAAPVQGPKPPSWTAPLAR